MTAGHIRLGTSVAALRDYQIDFRRYRKLQVNPYSAKLSTGGDEYDDLGPWAYHVERDWQAGIGKKMEDEGGALFSTAETRVPNQICLPQIIKQSDARNDNNTNVDARNLGVNAASGTFTVTYTGLGDPAYFYCIPIETATQPPNPLRISMYVSGLNGAYIYAYILRSTTPLTDVDSDAAANWAGIGFVTSRVGNGFDWYSIDLAVTGAGVGSGNYYYLVFTATGIVTFAASSTGTGTEVYRQLLSAPSMSALNGAYRPIFTSNWYPINNGGTVSDIVRFNGTLYAASGTSLLKYTTATDTWAAVGSAAAQAITDLCVFGSTLYVGQASGNHYTCTTSDTFAAASVPGVLFAAWNGFLYRTTGINLYYSGDGSSWTGPIPVGHSGNAITGLSGAMDTVYIATTEALYYLAPGGIARGMTRWGSIRDNNGKALINHQGNLYAIVDGGVAQISISGEQVNVLPVWVNRDDDLVSEYLAAPVALAVSNSWLVVLVQQNATPKRNSVWCWTGQGWHFLAEFPSALCDSIAYDVTSSALWTGTRDGVFYRVRVPDYTINPVNDSLSSYVPAGWLETPWITGGLADVDKDFESVYVSGEELAAGQTVTVFWKVRGGTWQELGTVDSDGEELRWSNYATRPTAKEIKLGFRLFSNSLTATPTIDAIRLKYRPNVTDRWQWNLVLPFDDDQESLDGEDTPYTAAQQLAHFESLVKQTQPFFMEDVDGTQYEVVCTGYDLNIDKFEYYDGAKHVNWIAQVTLEQSYAA